ncbi:right-handed parallel beta-helix repeat-containing protein [Haloechinothrix salitolerans]|uniref:Right-handed parallel beta-helix repeat-containing protein n=1 Tax=Haloechinothrix salitolerans TaxID=926830 RepID=A0ABW2C343_9PSEU
MAEHSHHQPGTHRHETRRPRRRPRRTLTALLLASATAVVITGVVTVLPTSAEAPVPRLAVERTVTCLTDAEGMCTVGHTLGVVPTRIEVTPSLPPRARAYDVAVVPGSATDQRFEVQAERNNGKPKSFSRIRFDYRASAGGELGVATTEGTTARETTEATDPTPSTTTDLASPTPTTTATTSDETTTTTTRTTSDTTLPAGATKVCGTDALDGPDNPPAGAVVVPAGDNSDIDFGHADTTYWFEPGVHTLGQGEYTQIVPGDNATFIGAPGAVLDGQNTNRYAFTQHASGVTIRYLTIRDFVAPTNEGVVNHDSGDGWTIAHNTLINNQGAAMMAGSGQRMIGNCVKNNGQYGLNAFQAGNQIRDIVLRDNEFAGNHTADLETQIPGCGCSGAMKFWSVDGAEIVGNWIHDNHGPGIWVDTNNNDFLIEGNLIERNDGQAVFYEISYNVVVRDNVIRHNTWATGRAFANRGDSFPIGTVYLSEAGGEPRVPARTSVVAVSGNRFVNNWGGIVGWENADRFCGTNTTSECTLLIGEDGIDRCAPPGINTDPEYSDCRWKTQRLRISGNVFVHEPAKIDGGCPAGYCGVSALLANYGTWPDWSPYQGRTVQQAITFEQDNRWFDNDYTGPWRFTPYETGRLLTLAEWQAAPYEQDAGSS